MKSRVESTGAKVLQGIVGFDPNPERSQRVVQVMTRNVVRGVTELQRMNREVHNLYSRPLLSGPTNGNVVSTSY